jgi:hypothetical protein
MCHPNHPIGMETKKQNTSKYLNILNIYIYIYLSLDWFKGNVAGILNQFDGENWENHGWLVV